MANPSIAAGQACGPHGVIWIDGHCLPQGVIDPAPAAIFVFDVLTPGIAALMLVVITFGCFRQRTLTWSFLVATASASCWWLETFGDWAQHLLYSPRLHHYTLDWPYAAPHNPAMMPISYALYWWAHAWVILRLVQLMQLRFPALSMGMGIVILSAPVTFIWNLIIEGAATYYGLWTYDPPIGPAIEWSRGTFWPLTWPVLLMMGWINLIAWVVRLPEEQVHTNKLERLFGLDRLLLRSGWSSVPPIAGTEPNPMLGTWNFQVVRWLAWVAFFQVTFLLTLNVPLFLMRVLPGFHSFYLPLP